MRIRKIKVIVFSLIGVFNTLFDLALYVVMYNLSHSIVLANIVSTSAALIGSYFLNAKLTFKAKRWTPRTFVLFVAVTLFGLWVLQTLAIYILTPPLRHIPSSAYSWLGGLQHTIRTVLPKLLATGVTFAWNYLWYSKVIFKELPRRQQEEAAAEVL